MTTANGGGMFTDARMGPSGEFLSQAHVVERKRVVGDQQEREMPKKCNVCGETSPYPAWICMFRVMGTAEKDKPCSYSVEGNKRFKNRMSEKLKAVDSGSGSTCK